MVLIKLFWSFMKIGFTSFGGISMIPLVTEEVVSNGWMTASEVSDLVAIAEMTPGPLGFNCATFAGIKTAGVAGAIAANLGVLMPAITLCVAAAIFFERFKTNKYMQRILHGVRPACVGMVFGVVVSMALTNYSPGGSVSFASVAIGALDMFLIMKCKLSIPLVIGISAVLGIVLFGALGLT